MRILVLLSSILAACLSAAERPLESAPAGTPKSAEPTEVICTVNGERILRQQVEERMPPAIVAKLIDVRRRLIAVGRSEAEAQDAVDLLHGPVFRQALRLAVRECLMLQEARQQGLQVGEPAFSEAFEREWEALKARQQADRPGHEEKTVRERVRNRLLLQAFRRQEALRQDEEAWFRKALERSTVLDGGPDGPPLPIGFFFPNEAAQRPPELGPPDASKNGKEKP